MIRRIRSSHWAFTKVQLRFLLHRHCLLRAVLRTYPTSDFPPGCPRMWYRTLYLPTGYLVPPFYLPQESIRCCRGGGSAAGAFQSIPREYSLSIRIRVRDVRILPAGSFSFLSPALRRSPAGLLGGWRRDTKARMRPARVTYVGIQSEDRVKAMGAIGHECFSLMLPQRSCARTGRWCVRQCLRMARRSSAADQSTACAFR